MAIFRVEKSNDYTVMSNYHLRDKEISLKAKGLLSLMLSLPEEWDYTLTGLAAISKEGKDAIREAVGELEKAGYVLRRRTKGEGGKFAGNEYIIREYPTPVSPSSENPTLENPSLENPTQLNKDLIEEEYISAGAKETPPEPAPEPKPKRKAKQLTREEVQTQLIGRLDAFVGDRQDGNGYMALRDALITFLDAREQWGDPIKTGSSVTTLWNRLMRFSDGNLFVAVEMLETSINRKWLTVYPPKGGAPRPAAPQPGGEGKRWL